MTVLANQNNLSQDVDAQNVSGHRIVLSHSPTGFSAVGRRGCRGIVSPWLGSSTSTVGGSVPTVFCCAPTVGSRVSAVGGSAPTVGAAASHNVVGREQHFGSQNHPSLPSAIQRYAMNECMPDKTRMQREFCRAHVGERYNLMGKHRGKRTVMCTEANTLVSTVARTLARTEANTVASTMAMPAKAARG
jgi:hypothetical protein